MDERARTGGRQHGRTPCGEYAEVVNAGRRSAGRPSQTPHCLDVARGHSIATISTVRPSAVFSRQDFSKIPAPPRTPSTCTEAAMPRFARAAAFALTLAATFFSRPRARWPRTSESA